MLRPYHGPLGSWHLIYLVIAQVVRIQESEYPENRFQIGGMSETNARPSVETDGTGEPHDLIALLRGSLLIDLCHAIKPSTLVAGFFILSPEF